MNDGSSSRPHPRASVPVLMNVLEDGKAEPDNPFVSFSRGWQFRRMNRVKHAMDARFGPASADTKWTLAPGKQLSTS
jgi:hypothetical protein